MGLKKNIDVIAGIDISNGKATVALLDHKPDDLKRFNRSYKAIEVEADEAGLSILLALEFTVAILEPTGIHYSRIFAETIAHAGRQVLWVDHVVIANYRKAHQLPNKNDQADAIALACYGWEHRGKSRFFVSLEGSRVRELYLQLESLNGMKNPIVNRLRQQLAYDFPEASKRAVIREWCAPNPPGLWRFLAQDEHKPYRKWKEELRRSIGGGISPFSCSLATLLCQLERQEYAIELELEACLKGKEFTLYLEVFERYGISQRTAAALLSRIYPFEKFLDPQGRQIIEHIDNSKRNRSQAAFKLNIGLGMVQHQSGNSLIWKAGGAKYCRTALWRWCKVTLLMSGRVDTPELEALNRYYQQCTAKGNQRVMKTVSKMVRMLYRDLYNTVK